MPFTPTYQDTKPVVGGSADVWGGINNDRIGEAFVDFTAISVLLNATETVANAALPKAGGTATGDIVLADVGPGSQFSAGYRGVPVVSIDANRTFVLTDAGKMIRLTGTTNRTWTIPPVGSVGFPVGTVIVLKAASTGQVSLVRGSGVQLRADGSATDTDKTIPAYVKATITQEATNVWSISGVG